MSHEMYTMNATRNSSRKSMYGIDDSNILSHVEHGFQNYVPEQEKRQKQSKIKKQFKDDVTYYLESLQRSIFTGIVLFIDILMNFILCILNIIDSYIDDHDQLRPLLLIELIITCYLFLSGIYELIVGVHIRRYVWYVLFGSSIITLIPLIYYFIQEESIFEGWKNHGHVSSLCFVRIFSLDVLITEALVYFWVGENQKLFHIVEKTLKTVIHTFSLLYFASSMFRLLEGFDTENDFHYFHNCFYFTVVTIITVGFGDITPVTPEGRIFCAVYILCFFLIFPTLLSSLVSAYKRRGSSALTFIKEHILYTGNSENLYYFIRKIKADVVVMLPDIKENLLSKRKYKRSFFQGDAMNLQDLQRANSKNAYQVILTSDGDDKKTFVRYLSLQKHCNCPIFVYLNNSQLFNTFRNLGVEVLCEEYVRLMLVGELCIPHYINVMRCLFSIKTKKNEINVLRNFKTPSYFVGKTGNTVIAQLMNELGIVVVAIMSGERMYYFDCDKELVATDRIFVISNEEKYRKIKDTIITTKNRNDILQMEGGEYTISSLFPIKHFSSRYKIESVIVEYIEVKNHKLVLGYHRGIELVLRKFRERNKEDIFIVVNDLKEIEYDWISLSYVDNLFIILGNLYEEPIYHKLNMMKASSIMILPSDSEGKDESGVIIISTIVHNLVEEWKTNKYYESQYKGKLHLKDIPIICELAKNESERFVKEYASCYCDSFACEMICNMVRHRYNNRIWLDLSTVTSDVTIVNIPVPGIMIGCVFQSVYIYLIEKKIKCLGILKTVHGRYNIYSKRSYKLKEDDILICVVKQHETVSNDIGDDDFSVNTVQTKILDSKRLNELDTQIKYNIEMDSESSTSSPTSSQASVLSMDSPPMIQPLPLKSYQNSLSLTKFPMQISPTSSQNNMHQNEFPKSPNNSSLKQSKTNTIFSPSLSSTSDDSSE